MERSVVIVSPISSGADLARTFKEAGFSVIGVLLINRDSPGYGLKLNQDDFVAVYPYDENLISKLEIHKPIAILPGSDDGVALAEELSLIFTPHFTNDPNLGLHRIHKALMQEALTAFGVATLKTLNAKTEEEVIEWLRKSELENESIIVKPPISAGSDKVFHVEKHKSWKEAFRRIKTENSVITQRPSETVVIQEEAIGVEYAVGTVSANGEHSLIHLIQYNKREAHGHKTLYDFVEFVEFDPEKHSEIWNYVKSVLDALGVRWGASHTEIMLTASGPRLIETGIRMLGGPTVAFAREATGSSQADALVQMVKNQKIGKEIFEFKKTVMPVFIKSSQNGTVQNAEIFDDLDGAKNLFKKHLFFKNGQSVPQTLDYMTSIGIIALSGKRDELIHDYKKIREIEKRLVIL